MRKPPRRLAGELAGLDALDLRQRRRLALEAIDESGQPHCSVAADADQHALAVVQHLAGEAELARDAPDGRPKADALHAAAHPDLDRDFRPGDPATGGERRRSATMPELFPVPAASHAADLDIAEYILEIGGDPEQHQHADGRPGDPPPGARRFFVHRLDPLIHDDTASSLRGSGGIAGSATSSPTSSSTVATAWSSAAPTGSLSP